MLTKRSYYVIGFLVAAAVLTVLVTRISRCQSTRLIVLESEHFELDRTANAIICSGPSLQRFVSADGQEGMMLGEDWHMVMDKDDWLFDVMDATLHVVSAPYYSFDTRTKSLTMPRGGRMELAGLVLGSSNEVTVLFEGIEPSNIRVDDGMRIEQGSVAVYAHGGRFSVKERTLLLREPIFVSSSEHGTIQVEHGPVRILTDDFGRIFTEMQQGASLNTVDNGG